MKERSGLSVSPWSMGARSWLAVLKSAWKEAGSDNIGLIAAGVSFYGFLAIVPMLGAIVLSYGIVAEPSTVMRNMTQLTSVMPADAAKLIGEQLLNVVTTSGGKKGFGLLLALGLALYGAMKGAGAVITALNIAYEEKETRGVVRLNLLTLAITIGAVLMAIAATIAVGALGHLETFLPGAPGLVLLIGKLASYGVLGAAGAAAAATLYRFAPDREAVLWVWLTPGSIAVTTLWLALTLGFGAYVANFGSYDATYGSLGAVVVLLSWLYLSAYILIMGAELNSELEQQTAADAAAGKPRRTGTPGVDAADTGMAQTSPDGASISLERDHVPAVAREDHPPLPAQTRATRTVGRDLLASWAAGHLARVAGAPRLKAAPALLSVVGLALIRRPRRAATGVVMIATASLLAWLGREDPLRPAEGAAATDV